MEELRLLLVCLNFLLFFFKRKQIMNRLLLLLASRIIRSEIDFANARLILYEQRNQLNRQRRRLARIQEKLLIDGMDAGRYLYT